MNIDHVVLWVDDPKSALAFYCDVVGLAPVRAAEFEAGRAPFPSVRINETTILDLIGRAMTTRVGEFTGGGEENAGARLNHLCLSMSAAEHAGIAARLAERAIALTPGPEGSFGAQGFASGADYFNDPDGNVVEIRHYGGTG